MVLVQVVVEELMVVVVGAGLLVVGVVVAAAAALMIMIMTRNLHLISLDRLFEEGLRAQGPYRYLRPISTPARHPKKLGAETLFRDSDTPKS